MHELAPQGVDVYFDNVGSTHLQAALNHANDYARFVMCGMIADYNADTPPPGPKNLMQIVAKRITMQGFIVSDFEPLKDEFIKDMSHWLQVGKIKSKLSVLEGIENAPKAFLNLFSGENFGKMLVKL